jgi:hypothetical protein
MNASCVSHYRKIIYNANSKTRSAHGAHLRMTAFRADRLLLLLEIGFQSSLTEDLFSRLVMVLERH